MATLDDAARACANYLCVSMRTILTPLILLVLASGCHTGRVQTAQLTLDGSLLAYRESGYDHVYVADALETRFIADAQYFLISPDGRWMLLLRDSGAAPFRPRFHQGAVLSLVDLHSRIHSTTRLPFQLTLVKAEATESHPILESTETFPREYLCFWFGTEGGITLGPVNGEFWAWQPDARWSRRAQPGEDGIPAIYSPIVPKSLEGQLVMHNLGPGADRWTVWERPDGKAIELCRDVRHRGTDWLRFSTVGWAYLIVQPLAPFGVLANALHHAFAD